MTGASPGNSPTTGRSSSPMTRRFHIGDRFKSFGFALNGLGVLLKTQHNAWLHLLRIDPDTLAVEQRLAKGWTPVARDEPTG